MNEEAQKEPKPANENVTFPAGDWRQELLAKMAPPAEQRVEESQKTDTYRGYF